MNRIHRITIAGLVLLLLTYTGAPQQLTAQVLDPDWCLTCLDSRLHAAGGLGLGFQ